MNDILRIRLPIRIKQCSHDGGGKICEDQEEEEKDHSFFLGF
jgi:hypothetical protein